MVQDGKTILVIDDDPDFQFMVSGMLQHVGYGVKYLVEGRVNAAVDSAKHCDVVLLDVNLPGMNGIDIARELKSTPATESIPIILITGHCDSEKLLFESKANALFTKPFSLAALLQKITELLTARSSRNVEKAL